MIQLEGLAHKARGYVELAHGLEIDFYPVLSALPYQIGAIKAYRSKARDLYDTVVKKSLTLDDGPDDTGTFSRVPIPPLSQIVMTNAQDSIEAIATEIADLRYRQRSFRKYLTDYQRQWETAETRAERFKLRKDFDNAWQTFVKGFEKPSTRIIYTLWDIFKNPTNILPAIGDKLRAKGHELSIIGKVRGLHDFWEELVASPVPDNNALLVSRLFPRLADEKEWDLSRELANHTNAFLNQPTEPEKTVDPIKTAHRENS